MAEDLGIREERPGEADAIARLVTAAFLDAAHADGTEAVIVDRLRAAGALAVSLVAVDAGRIVGHIAFSPVTIAGVEGGWFCLAPVAVASDCRRRGIGEALVRAGLDRLRRAGAAGCVVLGDPAWYARFGFRLDPGLVLPGVPAEYFQALPFEASARGEVALHAAFDPEP